MTVMLDEGSGGEEWVNQEEEGKVRERGGPEGAGEGKHKQQGNDAAAAAAAGVTRCRLFTRCAICSLSPVMSFLPVPSECKSFIEFCDLTMLSHTHSL